MITPRIAKSVPQATHDLVLYALRHGDYDPTSRTAKLEVKDGAAAFYLEISHETGRSPAAIQQQFSKLCTANKIGREVDQTSGKVRTYIFPSTMFEPEESGKLAAPPPRPTDDEVSIRLIGGVSAFKGMFHEVVREELARLELANSAPAQPDLGPLTERIQHLEAELREAQEAASQAAKNAERVQQLEEELAEKEGELAGLRSTLGQLQANDEQQSARISELTAEMEPLRSENTRLATQVRDLKAELEEEAHS